MKNITFLILLFFCFGAYAISDIDDSAQTAFYTMLESQLRQDYWDCTGDSTQISVKQLIRWKHRIDSMIDRPDYSALAADYRKQTGKSPVIDRPCVVIQWKWRLDSIQAEVDRLAAERKKRLDAERAESLAVYQEISKLSNPPCLLAGIPFGANRLALSWLIKHRLACIPSDKGPYLVCDSLVSGGDAYAGAFFLDQVGGYFKYELEGRSFPADSLNQVVRKQALRLASVFEQKIGRPPNRTNRIGRDEITPKKLSILKAWSDSTWSVSVGISVLNYRYYAKAVVTNAPLKRE